MRTDLIPTEQNHRLAIAYHWREYYYSMTITDRGIDQLSLSLEAPDNCRAFGQCCTTHFRTHRLRRTQTQPGYLTNEPYNTLDSRPL
jgi:hypothetical protein